MRVLKSGKLRIHWKHIAICPTCQAKLEIEKDDCIEKIDFKGYGSYYECDCPECNGQITISSDIVKKHIDIALNNL
jgi:uncharacterized protein with PIN domain